jgi:hypothetical protein
MDRRILFFLTESVWPPNAVPRHRTAGGVATDRRIQLVLTQSVWPSSTVPRHRTADGIATDRRILFFLTESIWPSSSVPRSDSVRVDDLQTNPVHFDCLGVERYYVFSIVSPQHNSSHHRHSHLTKTQSNNGSRCPASRNNSSESSAWRP